MAKVTASGLSLLRYCSFPYQDNLSFPPDPMGPKARTGTAVHLMAEWTLTGELGKTRYPQDAIIQARVVSSEVSRAYAMYDQWLKWYESLGRPPMRPEVPYEYDVTTGEAREAKTNGQRGYAYEPRSVYGTADHEWFDGEKLSIYDIKTGRPDSVARARVNTQVGFLGMCAAKVRGVDSVKVSLLFVDEHDVYPDEAELDYFELSDFESWLRERHGAIGTEAPRLGEWCTGCYCKLRKTKTFAGCPAYAEQKEAI